MNAYDKMYLEDAMQVAGAMFDCAVNSFSCPAEEFCARFLSSGIAERFSYGDVSIIAGKSGSELAHEVLRLTGSRIARCGGIVSMSSPEYWAGWALAYYQWKSGLTFKQLSVLGLDMFRVLPMFNPLHEADLSVFCTHADGIVADAMGSSPQWIKRLRRLNGFTQERLSEITGVPIRLIRAYEQKAIDPANAESRTVNNLRRGLNLQ